MVRGSQNRQGITASLKADRAAIRGTCLSRGNRAGHVTRPRSPGEQRAKATCYFGIGTVGKSAVPLFRAMHSHGFIVGVGVPCGCWVSGAGKLGSFLFDGLSVVEKWMMLIGVGCITEYIWNINGLYMEVVLGSFRDRVFLRIGKFLLD